MELLQFLTFLKEDISKTFSYPKEKIFVTHLAAEEIYTPLNKFHSSQYLKNTMV